MKPSRLLFAAAVALLLTAVGLVVYGSAQIPPPRFTGHLKDLLPSPPPGWAMKEKPIAESPEMQEAVGELLNFDDGVFVDYTSITGERLSVYIAYWTPGKMSHRLVAGHTPDVCWVGGGWKKTNSSRLMKNGTVPEGESRIFIANNTPEYVWFWHIVGTESKSYATSGRPPWHAMISDVFQMGLAQREEQFFIRISSNRPLGSPANETMLSSVLKRMPWPEKPK